jgi:hypothetical protein
MTFTMMEDESKINDDKNLVPDNIIAVVTETDNFNESVFQIVEPLIGNKKRDWFDPHFYFCLPLVIGNQYGFIIKSIQDFKATWNGSADRFGLTIESENSDSQFVTSHFGSGIITVQNRFHFRTPQGINLMTLDPPNFINPYLRNLTAVVESDNLRRDFTFNIKITVPNQEIVIKKGDPIAAILPVPRYFVDSFKIKLAKDLFCSEVIENERKIGMRFSEERRKDSTKPRGVGKLYHRGLDADGNLFKDHQNKILKK